MLASSPKDTRLTVEAIEAVKDNIDQHHYDVLAPWARGATYFEISNDLAVPLGTVKSRINRGRAAVVRHTAAMAHQPAE
jgi:hypothetical protein